MLDSDVGELFIKYRRHPPTGLFQAEAAGLAALAESKAIPVVQVRAVNEQCICLNHLPPRPATAKDWARAGENLARLHQITAPQFGFDGDNYCGDTRQINRRERDGYQFFSQHRLLYQAGMAHRRGLLSSQQVKQLERLCQHLPELIPPQPAALIHGDLWRGNLHSSGGELVLIDPACHFGWPEAELAMTTLFGNLHANFYEGYQHVSGIDSDWRQRADLYNLYHLLNHLNLFGNSYLPDIDAIIRRFGAA
ncbi:fructosamine kinase family protein [Motiliproteus sediminis]|uniref:fructosamine kinase family protein n=1 Tax=Motiliproteus sediminis TaxID=1468178 RepID=UPI001AEFF500